MEPEREQRVATIVVNRGIFRKQLDGLVVIVDGQLGIARAAIGDAPVVEDRGAAVVRKRLIFQSFGVGRDRLFDAAAQQRCRRFLRLDRRSFTGRARRFARGQKQGRSQHRKSDCGGSPHQNSRSVASRPRRIQLASTITQYGPKPDNRMDRWRPVGQPLSPSRSRRSPCQVPWWMPCPPYRRSKPPVRESHPRWLLQ